MLFRSHFSDIHCGMRGITTRRARAHGLRSQSWEYASEMVLKSVHMGLRTTRSRSASSRTARAAVSHHKRSGWFSPWQAAWINLRAMFVYGADFFLFRPGFVLFALRPAAHAAAHLRRDHDRPDHVLPLLDAPRPDPDGARAAVHLLRLLGPGLPRLHR